MLYFKTVIAAAITMASLASFAFAENIKAPDFTLLDVNGKKVTLSEARGKVVFIDFWASWCPPCRASIPAVEKLYDKYKGKDVEFYGINLEGNTPAIRKFIEKNSMKYTVLFDDRNKPALAIELDDRSHFRWDRMKRDQFVDDLMDEVGLRIIHIRASYSYDIDKIKRQIFAN
ncbi:MAG: hypothetical protein A2386_03920 [Elusimicrobia bacterium RIFOXYB1_FULL_48_9]|nr:MAG: hypothetical protein A2386_03920 [Elusimicrobia bacterium RIFOXYB1_FULL_48_9]